MELKFKMAYLKSICERYHQVSKRLKGKILDEFCKVCGYDRKYAIQKLNGPNFEDKAYLRQKRKSLRRRPVLYGPEVINLLSKVWEAAGFLVRRALNQLSLYGCHGLKNIFSLPMSLR